MRKVFKINDLIIVAVLLLLALAIWAAIVFGNSQNKLIAVIEKNGEQLYEFNLSEIEEQSIEIEGYGGIKVKIAVSEGRIRFTDSECKDLICVRTGWLSEKGQSAICLPARICIYIKGAEKSEDAVTG